MSHSTVTHSRPGPPTTGWPASCLSLGAHYYARCAESPTWPGTPVSADAEAHLQAARLTGFIWGRMHKIDRTAAEHEAAK